MPRPILRPLIPRQQSDTTRPRGGLQRSRRTDCAHLEVLIADLNHFKRVNNTYGHLVGDLVLPEAARHLRDTARHYDHVGRIGEKNSCGLNTKAGTGSTSFPIPTRSSWNR
ncbi:MAG: diguanylate cyclase [Nitrospiraceae bacterium]